MVHRTLQESVPLHLSFRLSTASPMVIFLGDLVKLWLKGQETFRKTTYLLEKMKKRLMDRLYVPALVSKFMCQHADKLNKLHQIHIQV